MATQSATRKTRKPYDPGTPAGIEVLSFRQGLFHVRPFAKPTGKPKAGVYQVDLQEDTCTCEHFQYRIAPAREAGEEAPDCKHLELAREESRRIALDVARQLSPVNLRKQILRTDLRPEVHAAVQEVSWERMTANRPGSLSLPAVIETARRAAELTPA